MNTKQITFLHSLASGTARFVALLALSLPLVVPTQSVISTAFVLSPVFAQEGVEPAKRSNLVAINLPANTMRATNEEHLAQFTEALSTLAKNSNSTVGKVEVLVWQSKVAKKTIPGLLKEKGYAYSAQATVDVEGGTATAFHVKQKGQDSLIGLWMEKDDVLLLAWASVSRGAGSPPVKEVLPPSEDATEEVEPAPVRRPTPASAADSTAPANALIIPVAPQVRNINVMKSAMPKPPTFPKLAKKPGYVRGYVYDVSGKPLKGAKLGVRSTAGGGFYSGASAKTDERGYYEIQVPWGAAHFYCAGYAIPYGEGRAAMALHPASGELEGFASANGAVENFTLFSYGIGDPNGVQDNPQYAGNYYGGSFVLGWYVNNDDRWTDPKSLPMNATIEVTLTPDGPLSDGSKGRPIVIRKNVGDGISTQLWVNNIPVGIYTISAKVVGGGQLKIRETGMYSNLPFGLEGKEAVGSGKLTFRPGSADPNSAGPGHGNWNSIGITLEVPQ